MRNHCLSPNFSETTPTLEFIIKLEPDIFHLNFITEGTSYDPSGCTSKSVPSQSQMNFLILHHSSYITPECLSISETAFLVAWSLLVGREASGAPVHTQYLYVRHFEFCCILNSTYILLQVACSQLPQASAFFNSLFYNFSQVSVLYYFLSKYQKFVWWYANEKFPLFLVSAI